MYRETSNLGKIWTIYTGTKSFGAGHGRNFARYYMHKFWANLFPKISNFVGGELVR